MKSNYKNANVNFIEMPLKVFAAKFPEVYLQLAPDIDINDNNYIVRFKEADGKFIVEIGYRDDVWRMCK